MTNLDGDTASRDRGALELLAAVGWRIKSRFAPRTDSLREQAAVLARCIAAQVRSFAGLIDDHPCDYAICTTAMPAEIGRTPPIAAALFDGIGQGCGRRPLALLHTYECAGWGYALRFFLEHSDTRLVLLTISDIDAYDLKIVREPPVIGTQGFGITTLLFRMPETRELPGQVGANSGAQDLIRTVRARRVTASTNLTFLPFFQENLARIAERMLDRSTLGPNRQAHYGHCFGSDPWIGIIEWLQANPLTASKTVTAAMLSWNGYFALADVVVSPATSAQLQSIEGDEDSLARAMAGA